MSMTFSRWLAPAALAVALGLALTPHAQAQSQSQDNLIRVLVDVADVVMRGKTPYYRQGDYGNDDRLVVQRDRYGRPVYYRSVPRGEYYGRNDDRYGDGHDHDHDDDDDDHDRRDRDGDRRMKCNKHGKCKAKFYDPRYDRAGQNSQARYDRDGRYWDGRQWRNSDHRYSNRHRDDDDDDD